MALLPRSWLAQTLFTPSFWQGLTGALQFGLGNVDLSLVACVIVGSIPGGLLGAYLTKYLPAQPFSTNSLYGSRGGRHKNVMGLHFACSLTLCETEYLARIQNALKAAHDVVQAVCPGHIQRARQRRT